MLGTPAYMSPEQAHGTEVDAQTDVWAFGVCLFEALTGRTTFAGSSAAAVLAEVLKTEPDWETLPEDTPPAALHLPHRCVAKDRRDRLHHIADARLEIQEALEELASSRAPTASASTGPATRVVIRVDPDWQLIGDVDSFAAPICLSPDGRFLVYRSNESGRYEIYVKSWPEGPRRWTVSTDGGRGPRWSPRGDEIFYRKGDALMAVSAETREDGELKLGEPEMLFRIRCANRVVPNYDVVHDGQRFVMVLDDPEDDPREIRMVLNWLDEVRALASRQQRPLPRKPC